MKRVILESPYGGDVERNAAYLRECIRDCLKRGEAPFASHRMYTDALDDTIPYERDKGMIAGFAWHDVAEAVVVYIDHGISDGMKRGIANANRLLKPMTYRRLYPEGTT